MILPETRFLWLATATLLPAALLAVLAPGFAGLLPLAFLVLTALALVEIVLLGRQVATVSVAADDTVRFSCGREASVALHLAQPEGTQRRILLGLALPEGMSSSQPFWQGELRQAYGTLQWPLSAERRGHYALGPVYLRHYSPLRLWTRQVVCPIKAQAAVYPNLAAERKALAALFLNRSATGMHLLRQVGQGREFEKVREYLPGDCLGDIHWKATAKRRHLVTKEFQLEKTQRVFVCVDTSRLSARRGDEEAVPLLERFVGAALTLAQVAERQGDQCGLAPFSDQMQSLVRFGAGRGHFGALRDAVYRLTTSDVSPDFRELAASLGLHLRRRSLIMVLTSLDDPAVADDFIEHFTPLASRHLVVVAMARPEAARPLYSGPEVNSADALYQRLGGQMVWNSLQELTSQLRRKNIGFALVERDRLALELVSHYLDIKRRQVL